MCVFIFAPPPDSDEDADAEVAPLLQGVHSETSETQSSLLTAAVLHYAATLPATSPPSPSVIMELRPGTGGDEAALFTADLYKSYEKSAKLQVRSGAVDSFRSIS